MLGFGHSDLMPGWVAQVPIERMGGGRKPLVQNFYVNVSDRAKAIEAVRREAKFDFDEIIEIIGDLTDEQIKELGLSPGEVRAQ